MGEHRGSAGLVSRPTETMEPIVLEAELSTDDYLEATRFTQRLQPDRHRAWRIANVIGSGAGFAFLFAADSTSWPAPVLLILLGLFNVLNTMVRPTGRWKQKWNEHAHKWGHMTIHLCDEFVFVQRSHVTHKYEWHAFIRFAETRHLFLLYTTDTSCEIIPFAPAPIYAGFAPSSTTS